MRTRTELLDRPEGAIDEQLGEARRKKKHAATEHKGRMRRGFIVLLSVLRLLIFQGLALRGHDELPGSSNRGNFLEFVEFASTLSDDLAYFRRNSPSNATYLSSTTQNELIDLLFKQTLAYIRLQVIKKTLFPKNASSTPKYHNQFIINLCPISDSNRRPPSSNYFSVINY